MTSGNGFMEQEESSVMESPKRETSEWTDEKHGLYLKSMESSFVDQLYNYMDMRSSQTQNKCSSDSMSSRKVHANNHCPSGQFKVLQQGSWSRINFRRENLVRNEENRPHVSSTNPWIQHFKHGNRHTAVDYLPPQEKTSLTSCSNTEVTDQNFVEEDSAMQTMNTSCNKKRKNTSAVSLSGNDQAASIWHISCHRNG